VNPRDGVETRTIPLAALVDPLGGVERLRRTGWPAEVVAALVDQARAVADVDGRWRRAEAATDAVLGRCLDVLDPADRARLEAGIVAAEKLSRASAPQHQRDRLEGRG
jgi:hypothetical protein